jgi:hypothetical protein
VHGVCASEHTHLSPQRFQFVLDVIACAIRHTAVVLLLEAWIVHQHEEDLLTIIPTMDETENE